MAPFAIDLREATNADWRSSFVLPADGVAPWSKIPVWASGTQYVASSAVQRAGNLYIAAVAAPSLGAFLDAEWTLIGLAADYSAGYDLTGSALRMYVANLGTDGAPLPDQIRVRLSTERGTLICVPSLRRVSLAIPALGVQAIPAGTYAVDVLAQKGSTLSRIAAGTITVDQGITR